MNRKIIKTFLIVNNYLHQNGLLFCYNDNFNY